jgi:hypothetical protein
MPWRVAACRRSCRGACWCSTAGSALRVAALPMWRRAPDSRALRVFGSSVLRRPRTHAPRTLPCSSTLCVGGQCGPRLSVRQCGVCRHSLPMHQPFASGRAALGPLPVPACMAHRRWGALCARCMVASGAIGAQPQPAHRRWLLSRESATGSSRLAAVSMKRAALGLRVLMCLCAGRYPAADVWWGTSCSWLARQQVMAGQHGAGTSMRMACRTNLGWL